MTRRAKRLWVADIVRRSAPTAYRCARGSASSRNGASGMNKGKRMTNARSLIAAVLFAAALGVASEAIAQPAKDTATPPAPPVPQAAPPAPAAPTVPPPGATQAPAEEVGGRTVVENPYGIEALWKQGDFVA